MIVRLGGLFAVLALSVVAQRQIAVATQPTDAHIATLEQRLKQSPGDVVLLNEMSSAYLQKMRETADGAYMERAGRIVDRVLQFDAKNYDARRRRVEIELQLHRFKNVVARTEELAAERPQDFVLYGLQGDALMEMGEYDRAPDAYQKMADLKPGLASYNRIAFYRFVTGDPEGAIAIMRKGIDMGGPPENVAWCLSDLGGMLFKTGEVDAAETAYRKALAVFPSYHHALAGMGRVLAAREKYQEAAGYFLKAKAVAPFPEYSGMLAKLYRRLGKTELAERELALLDVSDKLGKAAGESANRNLALAYADLKHNTARGLELARAELDIRRDVYTYDALAWTYFVAGNNTEAADAMRKALSQNTPEPQFHEHAARIFEAVGEANEARRQRELAASLNPHFNIS